MRIAVLTISDAGARGERADSSGDAIVHWATVRSYEVGARALVPDEVGAIVSTLTRWCDGGVEGETIDLALTTGGTGLSPRDVTPEATRAVIEREAPGIAERLRVLCLTTFPRAALSRGIAGTRKGTLIVNLPGSPNGVRDALAALDAVVDHAVAILSGTVTDHQPHTGAPR